MPGARQDVPNGYEMAGLAATMREGLEFGTQHQSKYKHDPGHTTGLFICVCGETQVESYK